jgi:hypothetical protein
MKIFAIRSSKVLSGKMLYILLGMMAIFSTVVLVLIIINCISELQNASKADTGNAPQRNITYFFILIVYQDMF